MRYGHYSKQKGTAVVELAAGFVLFAGLIITLIDVSRYLTVRAVLMKSAQEALESAEKIRYLDFDTYRRDLTNSELHKQYTENFLVARNAVIQKALHFATSTVVSPPDVPSAAQLVSFAQIDQSLSPSPVYQYSAVLLRPGERAEIGYAGSGNWVYHPTVCLSEWGISCASQLTDGDTQERVLQNEPLVVKIRAVVKPFMPLLPPLIAEGTAIGFRETVAKGSYPEFVSSASSSSSSSSTTSSSSSSYSNSSSSDMSSSSSSIILTNIHCNMADCAVCTSNGLDCKDFSTSFQPDCCGAPHT